MRPERQSPTHAGRIEIEPEQRRVTRERVGVSGAMGDAARAAAAIVGRQQQQQRANNAEGGQQSSASSNLALEPARTRIHDLRPCLRCPRSSPPSSSSLSHGARRVSTSFTSPSSFLGYCYCYCLLRLRVCVTVLSRSLALSFTLASSFLSSSCRLCRGTRSLAASRSLSCLVARVSVSASVGRRCLVRACASLAS